MTFEKRNKLTTDEWRKYFTKFQKVDKINLKAEYTIKELEEMYIESEKVKL